jgi:hypothetical protein
MCYLGRRPRDFTASAVRLLDDTDAHSNNRAIVAGFNSRVEWLNAAPNANVAGRIRAHGLAGGYDVRHAEIEAVKTASRRTPQSRR